MRALAQGEGTTFFTVALAAFQALLSRYSGQQEIVVGCPVAGRNRVESEDLMGVFINTLPLRAQLTEEDTFRQLLRRTARTVLAGLAHGEVPLQLMIQDVLRDRDTTGSPLFQVMFIHQRFSAQPQSSAGVTFTLEHSPAPATMVDLSLELTETESSACGRWNYRLELWEHSTIERMVGHFLTLLEAIAADPDQRIGELPLLTAVERQQLLIEWNDTAVDYPSDSCVHQLFEQQVESTPDAVAVVFEDHQLTYRQLNERANQLAHHLRTLGVGPETLVVLCVDRSLEIIVGLLAILKAGGAYVPLDPEFPSKRLDQMIADSNPIVIVTQQRIAASLGVHDAAQVFLDSQWDVISQASAKNPTAEVSPSHLAYVTYTSGSSGRPKGVAVEHRQLVNYVTGASERLEFEPGWTYALVSTLTADLGNTMIFPALCLGGSLHVMSKQAAIDVGLFADYLRDTQSIA